MALMRNRFDDRGGRASLREGASTLAVATVVVAVVGALFVGAGSVKRDLGFLDGGAWLLDEIGGVVGFSDVASATDLNPRVTNPGGVKVFQGSGGRFYLVDADGAVISIDASSSPPTKRTGARHGSGTAVRAGVHQTYVVNERRGLIKVFRTGASPADAEEVANLRTRIASVIDRQDRLWVLVPRDGRVLVHDGTEEELSADAGRGGASALAVLDDHALVATKGSATATVIDDEGSRRPLRLARTLDARPIASSNFVPGRRAAFLSGASVHAVSLDSLEGKVVELQDVDPRHLGAPETVGDLAWVPDHLNHRLTSVDLVTGTVTDHVDVPVPEGFDGRPLEFTVVVGADGTIWANAPGASAAVAVDPTGNVKHIQLGQRANVPDPVEDPGDTPLPAPGGPVPPDSSSPAGLGGSLGDVLPAPARGSGPGGGGLGPGAPGTAAPGAGPGGAPPGAPKDAVPPEAAVIDPAGSSAGNGSVDLAWGFPGGGSYTGVSFQILWQRADQPDSTPESRSVDGYRGTVEGLRNGRKYRFWVVTHHPELRREGLRSPVVELTPSGKVPGAPTIDRVVWDPKGDNTLTAIVTVEPPSDTGGSDITKVDVSVGYGFEWDYWARRSYAPESSTGPWDIRVGDDAPVRSPGMYWVEATVTNEEGRTSSVATYPGGESASYQLPRAPGAPTARISSDQPGRVTISWDPPTDVDTDFAIYGYDVLVDGAPQRVGGGAGARSHSLDQAPGTNPQYQVRAVNAVGPGWGSNPVSANSCDSPGPPQVQVHATPNDAYNTSFTIDATFVATDDGGCAVTGYVVNGAPTGTAFARISTNFPPSTTATVRVAACNSRGCSAEGAGSVATAARKPQYFQAIWTVTSIPGSEGRPCQVPSAGTCAMELESGWIRQEFVASGTVLRSIYAEVCSATRSTGAKTPTLVVIERIQGGNPVDMRHLTATSPASGCHIRLDGLAVGGFTPGEKYVVRFTNSAGDWLVAYVNQADTAAGMSTFRHHNGYDGQMCEGGHWSCRDARDVRLDLRMSDI